MLWSFRHQLFLHLFRRLASPFLSALSAACLAISTPSMPLFVVLSWLLALPLKSLWIGVGRVCERRALLAYSTTPLARVFNCQVNVPFVVWYAPKAVIASKQCQQEGAPAECSR